MTPHHRIQRPNCLENPNRQRILEEIRKEPGIRTGTLQGLTGLNYETVAEHLRVLERFHLVQSTGGGQRRYFINGGTFTLKEQAMIVASSAPAAKSILSHLGRSGETDLSTLCVALSLEISTASRATSRLEKAGVVARRRAGRQVLLRLAGQPVKDGA